MILTRPLISFDLESTGVDPNKDRIVEIAAIKRNPDGKKEEKVYLTNPGLGLWALKKDFPEQTKKIIKEILNGK